jgi:hypothetical protein
LDTIHQERLLAEIPCIEVPQIEKLFKSQNENVSDIEVNCWHLKEQAHCTPQAQGDEHHDQGHEISGEKFGVLSKHERAPF